METELIKLRAEIEILKKNFYELRFYLGQTVEQINRSHFEADMHLVENPFNKEYAR